MMLQARHQVNITPVVLGNKMKKRIRIAICTTYAGDEGVSTRIRAFNKACEKRDISLVTLSSAGGFFVSKGEPVDGIETNAYETLDFSDFDAIICYSEIIKDKNFLEFYVEKGKEYGIPVFMEERHVDGGIDIVQDYTSAFEELVRHVIVDHGCRKVFFMGGMPDNSFSLERELVYKKVLEENGLKYDKKNVYYGEFWDVPTEREMDRMISSGNIPEALVCANDFMAITACKKFKEAGYRVPEDVIVTGLDGVERAEWNRPTITTCYNDPDYQAEQRLDFVLDWINGKTKEMKKVLHYSFRKAESCGCMCNLNAASYDRAIEMYMNNRYLLFYNLSIYEMQEEFARTNDKDRLRAIVEKCFEFEGVVALSRDFDQYLEDDLDEGQLDDGSKPYRLFYSTVPGYRKNELVDFKTLYTMFDGQGQTFIMPINFMNETYGFFAVKTTEDKNFFNLCILLSIALGNSFGVYNTRNHFIKMNKELEEVNSALTAVYTTDNLTGLYNRHGFYDACAELMTKAMEERASLFIVSVDMDDLKVINDNYGHAEGDSALSTIASAIKDAADPGDVCSRFGGDEFIVAGISRDSRRSKSFLNKVNKYLAKYNGSSDKPYKVVASMGAGSVKASADFSMDDLIRVADREMYENKKEHKKNREKIRTTPEDLLHEIKNKLN